MRMKLPDLEKGPNERAKVEVVNEGEDLLPEPQVAAPVATVGGAAVVDIKLDGDSDGEGAAGTGLPADAKPADSDAKPSDAKTADAKPPAPAATASGDVETGDAKAMGACMCVWHLVIIVVVVVVVTLRSARALAPAENGGEERSLFPLSVFFIVLPAPAQLVDVWVVVPELNPGGPPDLRQRVHPRRLRLQVVTYT